MAKAGLQLSCHPLEERLERLEVLANDAIGDFLGGAFIGTLADVPELGDPAAVGAEEASAPPV